MRQFFLLIGVIIAALTAPASIQPALAASPNYTAGEQYQKIAPPQPTHTPGKIQVTEIFWYHCPHCFNLDPKLRRWLSKQPKDVVFRRVPATFGQLWKLDGKIFYTEKALGVLDKMHTVVFNAIHKKRRRLRSEQAYTKLFAEHGIGAQKFKSAFESFGVQSRIKRAGEYVRKLGVTSVPTLVIDGRYLVDAEMAGDVTKMLNVADFLIAKRRKAGD